MKRTLHTSNYSLPSAVAEQDFFECIGNSELYTLLMFLQQEKRENFKLYVQHLEFISEATSLDMIDKLEKEKKKFWQKQLHYEELAQWSFSEIDKRRNPPKSVK